MAGLFDKFKSAIGIEDEYYDDIEEDEIEEEDLTSSFTREPEEKTYERQITKRSNVMEMKPSSLEKPKIKIHEPLNYDDGPRIVDDILNRMVVVLNLEMLEIEKKKQVFDFVSGGIYALKGSIQKVTKDIFVIAPSNVQIDGKLKDEIKAKGFYQL